MMIHSLYKYTKSNAIDEHTFVAKFKSYIKQVLSDNIFLKMLHF